MSLHSLVQEKGNLIFMLNISEAKLILCRKLKGRKYRVLNYQY
jgi:hypothetical protein